MSTTATKYTGKAKPRALTPEQVKECKISKDNSYVLAERYVVDRRTIRRAKQGYYNV